MATFELSEFDVGLSHVSALEVTVITRSIKKRCTEQIGILEVGKTYDTLLKRHPLEILSFQIDVVEIDTTGNGLGNALL